MRGNTFRKRLRSKKRGVKRNKSKKNLKKLMRGGKLKICHFGLTGKITTTKIDLNRNVQPLNDLNDHEYSEIRTQINNMMAVELKDLSVDDIAPLTNSLTLIFVAINNIISNYNSINSKYFIHMPVDEINSKMRRCKTSLASIFKNFKDSSLDEHEFEEIKSENYSSFYKYLELLEENLDKLLKNNNITKELREEIEELKEMCRKILILIDD